MVRSSVKTITYKSGSRNTTAANRVVAKAATLLRKRMAAAPRAPLRTGGFYGVYNRRGRDELKFIDNSATAQATSAAGIIALLNGITQGADFNNRIGRKVTMKSLLLKVSVGLLSTTSSLGGVHRFLVVYDAQTNGATPAITDVLATANYLSPMNLNNRDRFKVLMDFYHKTDAYTVTAGAISAGSFTDTIENRFRKFNLEEQFSGTTNAVGSIATGAVFLIVISDVGTAPIFDFYSRIRYTDT